VANIHVMQYFTSKVHVGNLHISFYIAAFVLLTLEFIGKQVVYNHFLN